MALPSKTQAQYVSQMVSEWATLLAFTPTLPVGDPLLALMESISSQFVFLQALAQAVNLIARAQTSTGADLDSFYAQFGFTRSPAVAAEGPVILTKLTPATSQVLIPPGVTVQTVGGAIQYQTIADANQPTWNPTLNAYVLQVGQTSLTASAQALKAGAAYNVAANQIAQIASSLAGIDQVNNAVPIANGVDAESDASYRVRFVLFLNSLSKATRGAIVSAIEGVQQGIEYNVVENVNLANQTQIGEFIAIIDNGTGSPPASLITAVQNILEVTRGFTIEAQASAVLVTSCLISLAVRVATGFIQSVVNGQVANAVAAAVNATPIGGGEFDENGDVIGAGFLYISLIERAALTVAGVVSVQPGQTVINHALTDLAVNDLHAARTTVNTVSVGNY